MILPPATPDQLAIAPELSVLEALAYTAQAARNALLAANLDIAHGHGFLEEVHVSPSQCLTAGLLSALDLLDTALERYRMYTVRHGQWPTQDSNNPF